MEKIKSKVKSIISQNTFLMRFISCVSDKYSILEIKALTDYCEDNNLIVKMIDDRKVRRAREKVELVTEFVEGKKGWRDREVSPSYIAIIKNASFIGETDGVFIDDKYLLERIEWDRGGVTNYLPNNISVANEKNCLFNKKKLTNKHLDKGIVLIKMWSNNIFHFTFEVIAKLALLDKYYDDKTTPIIVDEIVKMDSRSLRLLEMANVNDREVIWIKKEERITVNKAIIPPCVAWGTFDNRILNEEGHGWILDARAGNIVRELVFKNYRFQKVYDKVYVARGDNHRLINESELIEQLKTAGFEIFYPDTASFEEEVDCFATANVIVLCAGAAITNTLYCKESARIYQICPWEFQCATGVPIEDICEFTLNKIAGHLIQPADALNKSKFYISQNDIHKIINEENYSSIGGICSE